MGSRDPILVQAAYYLVTGIWPIIHLRSFMAVTGPKQDTWLVQTFGALIAAIGLALLPSESSHARRRVAAGSALALSAADVVFVARRRIRPIYLADAALEIGFALAGLRAASSFEPDAQSRRDDPQASSV